MRTHIYNRTFRTVSLERLAAASGCISSAVKLYRKGAVSGTEAMFEVLWDFHTF